jgi:hypothetical protein
MTKRQEDETTDHELVLEILVRESCLGPEINPQQYHKIDDIIFQTGLDYGVVRTELEGARMLGRVQRINKEGKDYYRINPDIFFTTTEDLGFEF